MASSRFPLPPPNDPAQPTAAASASGAADQMAAGTRATSKAREANNAEFPGGPDPDFLIFLLIGQSNMAGIPLPEAPDRLEHRRVKVLAYDHCALRGRTYNRWHCASPPLHDDCLGVGPGDYFARTLVAALPERYSIGLVPCAVSGVDIDFFRKDVVSSRRGEFRIPPDDSWSGAYDFVMSRAQLAAKAGIIRGILFHQGESDSGQTSWLDKVQDMVRDLRTDLGLGDSAPFLAGELYHGGRCAAHNTLISELPSRISNSTVVSASGLNGLDPFHFDLPGQRELGARYGNAMLSALGLP